MLLGIQRPRELHVLRKKTEELEPLLQIYIQHSRVLVFVDFLSVERDADAEEGACERDGKKERRR